MQTRLLLDCDWVLKGVLRKWTQTILHPLSGCQSRFLVRWIWRYSQWTRRGVKCSLKAVSISRNNITSSVSTEIKFILHPSALWSIWPAFSFERRKIWNLKAIISFLQPLIIKKRKKSCDFAFIKVLNSLTEKINQMLHKTVTKDSHWLFYKLREKKTFLISPQKNFYPAFTL